MLVVVVAIDVLGVGDAGVGVLTAAVGAGAVIGSLAVSLFADGRRLAAMLGVGVALWGLPLAVVGVVPREGVILPMLAAVGVGNAMVDVGIFTLPPRLVPDAVLARLFGALESLGCARRRRRVPADAGAARPRRHPVDIDRRRVARAGVRGRRVDPAALDRSHA